MQIFQVKGNGEAHEITENKPIKQLLQPDGCFILVDDNSKAVYCWIGTNAPVRLKFNGARISQDIRSQVGLSYRSISLEEGDQHEDPDFMALIETSPSSGFAREIRDDAEEIEYREPSTPIKPLNGQTNGFNSGLNAHLEQTGPLYTGSDAQESVVRSLSEPESKKIFSGLEINKIIETLDDEVLPEGFEREMVIIGNTSYSVTEKVQTFLGKKTKEIALEPISTLPEGVFFAEGYVPRVLVQNHIVVAIEFLKKKY